MHLDFLSLILVFSLCLVTRTESHAQENADGLSLQVAGDEVGGYGVTLVYDGKKLARHNDGGEFSLILQNAQFNAQWPVKDWKATRYEGDEKRVVLKGQIQSMLPGCVINATVTYEIINPNLVCKKINLQQCLGAQVYYRIENRLEPLFVPESYWTFEQSVDKVGGSFYEVYPAAGFRGEDVTVGLLTDAGTKNLWNRTTRQSDLSTLTRITDTDLVSSARPEQRQAGHHYVALNFGRLDIFEQGNGQDIELPAVAQWNGYGGVSATSREDDGEVVLERQATPAEGASAYIDIPMKVSPGDYFIVSFDYQSPSTFNMKLFGSDGKKEYVPYYVKPLVNDSNEWKHFQDGYYIWNAEQWDESSNLRINITDSKGPVHLKNLQLWKIEPEIQAYHPLELMEPIEKTVMIFVEPKEGHRQEMISAQTRLAEGLGFEGTMAEKILFATSRMLSWNLSSRQFAPHLVPSCNYEPSMFMRDAFWTVAAVYDRCASEGVWRRFAQQMKEDGGIPTLLSGYDNPMVYEENDSNMFFILLAYVNNQRYGTPVDLKVMERALDFIRRHFDPDKNGTYLGRSPGWHDIIWPKQKYHYSINQGMFAVTLRCAQAMGCEVREEEIKAAEASYRDLYDPERGYMIFGRNLPDMMATTTLLGEFLSWWLFKEPILQREMVINTIEAFPVRSNGTISLMHWSNGEFMSLDDQRVREIISEGVQPFFWKGGLYQNGGSWLLYEYLAYVCGLKHGWEPARERMTRRLEEEFNAHPQRPYSHEWIPLPEGAAPAREWWPVSQTGVYGWNSFVIIANEVAGLRKSGT